MMKQNAAPEDLLARIAERDPEALGELYDQYAPMLLGMLMRILGDRAAAEDILESVFMRLWNDARQFSRGEASPSAALVLTARARAIEKSRTGRGMPPLAPGLPIRTLAAWCPRRKEIAHVDERQELLRKVINQLPKPQREALELAVFEGLAEGEIAVKLGEPSARVSAGLVAAMRFLRHRLAAVLGTWTADI
jgi:RNA polymerase sigma-70 factor (ECF subfamily)